MFQSAPLTEARGDERKRPINAHTPTVSIRSPHRSKGRRLPTDGSTPCVLFQSAPLTEARGDLEIFVVASMLRGFNPLPSPKQGETGKEMSVHAPTNVSIRSPHRSKGRPKPGAHTQEVAPVSIRSPHRSKGRRWCSAPTRGLDTRFNPLPSPKQGETSTTIAEPSENSCFNPLPSPKQGETCG